jgi:hypothetical protein
MGFHEVKTGFRHFFSNGAGYPCNFIADGYCNMGGMMTNEKTKGHESIKIL